MKNYFIKKTFVDSIAILKKTFNNFISDRGLKLSASLSYYTLFSLAPLLLLLISTAGFFYGREAIQGHVFNEINRLIGNQAAIQIQEIIQNMELSGKTRTALVVGIVTLLIGATSVFSEIQDSINIIWKLKVKPKCSWVKIIKDRLLSSSLIVVFGFLLIVSLIINGVLLTLNNFLKSYFPEVTIILFQILNIIISFGVITILFGIIFKILPDAKIAWKDVRIGSLFTAFLFMIGHFMIGLYIQSSSTGNAYGAAGSLIIILVWVYYTAAILYFGAEFTKVYIEHLGLTILPAQYAVFVEEQEVELRP